MTTVNELVEQTPAADRGVPAGFVYGVGEWRHVLELADPGLGAAVAWHDLTPIVGLFTGYDYTRGADGYQGRYRASVVTLDLYADDDSFAPWNPDNSATFGTHVELGPGLLIRSGFIRVDGGIVVEWNPRFTCKVESWGDAASAKGRVRRHRVVARDTLSSLVGVPLPGRSAENWFERLVWIIGDSGWPYGWFAYGARHEVDGTTPILLLPDRPASSSALNELDAILDPVGLQWYTDRLGRLIVRPRVNDTFHAAAFLAGADGDEWPGGTYVNFAWWACGDQPGEYEGTDHAAYAVDTQGVEQFGFDSTDRWVANHVKVTDPTGPGFDDDDPVSIARYDRKSLQVQWMAPNDTVAADLLAMRAYATVEARPLHTNVRLNHFHPGPARADFLDYVSVVHRNTDEGLEAFGNGWLRSYTEQVRPVGCDTDWSLALTIDIWAMSARDTFLLPVEDLIVFDITDISAEFSWTNPTQTVDPTHTQIRLINPASLWQTVGYPLDGVQWWGLLPETGYEFQVRLVRIVDGITTHYSQIRSVTFTTLEATKPVDDDGDIILPPPDDGCEVHWQLVSSPDGTDPWNEEDSGTVVEDPFVLPDYDMSSLDPDLWYRFQTREFCEGVPGALQIGDVFVVDCVGADRLGTPPYDDANLVAYWPEFCPNGAIRELVTGEPMIKGHALARVDVVDEVAVLVSGGPGLIGYQFIDMPLGSHDLTIGCRINIGTPPADETTVFEYGGAWISIVADAAAPDPDAAGFTINGNVARAGGVINTIEGATIFGLDTPYVLSLSHDPGTGVIRLHVDGDPEANAGLPFGDRATIGRGMSMHLPADSTITDAAAWDVVLAPPPPLLPTGEIAEIMAVSPLLYHTFDDLTAGVFANHGSLSTVGDMRDFNTASGAGAALITELQHPFPEALKLVAANGECATMHGVSSSFGVTGAMTYSVFAKFADAFPLPAHMTLSSNGDASLTLTDREHWFYVATNGSMIMEIMGPGEVRVTFTSPSGTVPDDGEWHMLSAVFVPSTSFRYYVDGIEVFEDTTGIPASRNDPSMQKAWGALSDDGTPSDMSQPPLFPFNGWLAHGFIEGSALSAATLYDIYRAVFP